MVHELRAAVRRGLLIGAATLALPGSGLACSFDLARSKAEPVPAPGACTVHFEPTAEVSEWLRKAW